MYLAGIWSNAKLIISKSSGLSGRTSRKSRVSILISLWISVFSRFHAIYTGIFEWYAVEQIQKLHILLIILPSFLIASHHTIYM